MIDDLDGDGHFGTSFGFVEDITAVLQNIIMRIDRSSEHEDCDKEFEFLAQSYFAKPLANFPRFSLMSALQDDVFSQLSRPNFQPIFLPVLARRPSLLRNHNRRPAVPLRIELIRLIRHILYDRSP
jgi:hypothetical protein